MIFVIIRHKHMVMLGIVRCKNGVNYHRDYELSGEINHTNNPCALK